MPRLVSLQNLMDRVRREADAEADAHKTDAEIIDRINAAVPAMHDLLVSAYGEDYHHSTEIGSFQVDKTNYPLPSDFYKLLGVDIETDTNSGSWFPARRFGERQRTVGEGDLAVASDWPRYRLRGRYVYFIPPPTDTRRYRLQYAPVAPVLVKRTFVAADVDTGQNQITLNDHGLLAQQPVRFTTDGTLPSGLVAATTYYVSIVDGNTIQLLDALDGNVVALSAQGSGTHTIVSMFDGVNGWEEFIVLEAAIGLLDKEETDTRSRERRRDKLEARLAKMADNRDSGEPETIQDVQQDLSGADAWERWPPPL